MKKMFKIIISAFVVLFMLAGVFATTTITENGITTSDVTTDNLFSSIIGSTNSVYDSALSSSVCFVNGSRPFTGAVSFGFNAIGNITKFHNTWYVKEGNWTDIQTKIDLAGNYDTVYLTGGTYDMHDNNVTLTVKSKLTIECHPDAKIYGRKNYEVMYATNGTTLSEFNLRNCYINGRADDSSTSSFMFYARLANVTDSVFEGNTFEDFHLPHVLGLSHKDYGNTTRTKIINNKFINVGAGVTLAGSYNDISDNYMLSRDYVAGSGEYGEGIEINNGNEHIGYNIACRNTIIGIQENHIDANSHDTVVCDNVLVGSNNIRQTTFIDTSGRDRLTITGNTISNVGDNDFGIDVQGRENSIVGNVVYGNNSASSIGMRIQGSNNKALGNKIYNVSREIMNAGGANEIERPDDFMYRYIDNDVLGYWTLRDYDGTNVFDGSEVRNDGTIAGDVSFNTHGAVFNSTDGVISVPYESNYDVGTNDFSWSFALNMSDIQNTQDIITMKDSQAGVLIYYSSSDEMRVSARDANDGGSTTIEFDDIWDIDMAGDYSYFTFVFSHTDSTVYVYVDGYLADTEPFSFDASMTADLTPITFSDATNTVNGGMSDVVFHDGALSEDEVTALAYYYKEGKLAEYMNIRKDGEIFVIEKNNGEELFDRIDDCDGDRGCHIYVPEGTYYLDVDDNIFHNKKNLIIEGAGMYRTKVVFNGSSGSVFYFQNSTNVTISGLEVDGQDTAQYGIKFRGGDYNNIDSNHVHDVTGSGIKLNGNCATCGYNDQYNIIQNNRVSGNWGGNGIDNYIMLDTIIRNNEVSHSLTMTGYVGIISTTGVKRTIIEDNYVHDIPEDGIQVRGYDESWGVSSDNVIKNNVIKNVGVDNGAMGILININISDTLVIGNYIYDVGDGVNGNCFKSSEGAQRTLLVGNYCNGADKNGFDTGGTASSGYAIGNYAYDVGSTEFSTTASPDWAYMGNSVDFNRLLPMSTPPTNPTEGMTYVDSDTNEFCFYDGSSWTGLKSGGACS